MKKEIDLDNFMSAIEALPIDDKMLLYAVVRRAYQCITDPHMHGLFMFTDEEELHTLTLNTTVLDAMHIVNSFGKMLHDEVSRSSTEHTH
jgi:hypothetical protein